MVSELGQDMGAQLHKCWALGCNGADCSFNSGGDSEFCLGLIVDIVYFFDCCRVKLMVHLLW